MGQESCIKEETEDGDDQEVKGIKKEKKAKKSKKKNKKKDKDSDSEEDCDKENKKRKKKSKKKKEKDHSESEEKEGEEQENDATKPLVPYEVADEGKSTPEESKSKTPDALDSSKFINSFGEVKFEEPKSKPMLPTLVFNEKTVELAPKDIASPPDSVPPKEEKSTPPQTSLPEVVMKPEEKTPLVKDCDKVDEIPSSKWDLDDTTEAYEEPDNPLVRSDVSPGFARDLDLLKAQLGGEQEFHSISKQDGGPENVLRR